MATYTNSAQLKIGGTGNEHWSTSSGADQGYASGGSTTGSRVGLIHFDGLGNAVRNRAINQIKLTFTFAAAGISGVNDEYDRRTITFCESSHQSIDTSFTPTSYIQGQGILGEWECEDGYDSVQTLTLDTSNNYELFISMCRYLEGGASLLCIYNGENSAVTAPDGTNNYSENYCRIKNATIEVSYSTLIHYYDYCVNGNNYLARSDDHIINEGSGKTAILKLNPCYGLLDAEDLEHGRDLVVFQEWNTSEDGTGTTYHPGDAYTGENLTLYAIYQLSADNYVTLPRALSTADPLERFYGWASLKSACIQSEYQDATIQGKLTKAIEVKHWESFDGTANIEAGDTFVARDGYEFGYGSLTHYGTDSRGLYLSESEEDTDRYYFVGTASYNTVDAAQSEYPFDIWKKIEQSNNNGELTWESGSKLFIYTDVITDKEYNEVGEGLFPGDSFPLTEDTVLYAQYKSDGLKITYDANGYPVTTPGTVTYDIEDDPDYEIVGMAPQTIQHQHMITLDPSGGSLNDTSIHSEYAVTYTLRYWALSKPVNMRFLYPGDVYSQTKDLTLYLYCNTSVSDSTLTTIPSPTRNGYRFNGWKIASDSYLIDPAYIEDPTTRTLKPFCKSLWMLLDDDRNVSYQKDLDDEPFVEFGYIENSEKTVVPVIYKKSLDTEKEYSEYTDHEVYYRYSRTEEIDGTTYDRWEQCEAGSEAPTCYVYTVPVVIRGDNHEALLADEDGNYTFTPNRDLTLVAQWEEAPTYTVTWKDGDGNVLEESVWNQGETPVYSGATPTKNSDNMYTYTFSGWAPEVSAVTEDTTYVAQFDATEINYTVTLRKEGGVISASFYGEGSSTHSYGETCYVEAYINLGYGYPHDLYFGWYDEDGNKVSIDPRYSFSVTRNITLTAKADPIQYTVRYDGNGADSGFMDDVTHTYDLTSSLESVNFTREGYTFKEWNTVADGTGTSYSDEQEVVNLTTQDADYVQLYAQWEPISGIRYTAEHYKEALDGSYTLTTSDTYTATFGANVTPSRKSYTGFTAPAAQTITIDVDESANVVKYYYTRNSYELVLNTSTGIKTVVGSGTYKYQASVLLDSVVNMGYKWCKWIDNDTGTEYTTKAYSFKMPARNVSLTAIAELNGVVYIDNGTSWDAYTIWIDNGTSWEQYIAYVDDGEQWVLCGGQ